MEEKKKLTYEELQRIVADLHQKNQYLEDTLKKYMKALDDKEFEYMAFFLTNLFKVVDHTEIYPTDFVDWCVKNIVTAMRSFSPSQDEGKGAQPEEENKAS